MRHKSDRVMQSGAVKSMASISSQQVPLRAILIWSATWTISNDDLLAFVKLWDEQALVLY